MASDADFERHIKGDALLPVYALVGSEAMLVADATAVLRQKTLTSAADFNRHEFAAGETAIERVIEAASTLPMMAPRRFVHLARMHALKAKDFPPLLDYLERPALQTVLCLSGDKVDQRTKLGQKLARSGGLFLFEPPRQQDLAIWIERRAKKAGFAIDHDAAQLLGDLIGTDVGSLDRALEKISLYAGSGNGITTDDVEAMVAPTRVHRIFELTDAIGCRDLGGASMLLRNTLGGGESALGVLGMITRQFRQLLQVKALAARRMQSGQIAATLGIRPFLITELLSQARRYEASELASALEAAWRADVRLKSSGVAPGVALDRLLVEVMGQSRP